MLVLLAVFMITAPIMNVSDISLPSVSGGRASPSHRFLSIKLSLDGIRFSDSNKAVDRSVTASELRGELSYYSNPGSTDVSILADEKIPYGQVMGIFSMLRSLGFVNLSLVVQDEVRT
ncbi:ExbD/TolR family protein [Candidatus Ichthyocystis sparus]|nr:biopolymer transporter ExbD [Candidatus Ichthyocystis sparus]